ncbi:gliding motility-associated protein GldE [Porphyromonas cangingivalis]|uniref:Gliding motility-associated protein GldE n=1 Tax=Porphyromonas cangingivalis TaxID=36874 RepID=A0A1T4N2L2_PORCN|nr:gliding motility-associated protein GldE [Porphyromonas cangingivalis]SJZ73361.1 gliding motility-associated protein GldE [Porphyromonas cangingivalis]VEJ04131.1 magnesium/cobalt efflux protein CorC [Porphyromonas cangingivalis]
MDIDGYLQQLFADITVTPLTWATGLALIVVVILLMLSAYMSGSEVAFFSLSPADLDEIRNSKDKRDTIIQELLADSERLLGTILVGNNMVNVAIVMLSNYIVSDTLDFSSAPILGFIVQVVLLTFLLLLFGEILPKIYCQNKSLQFSRFAASSMSKVQVLFTPISKPLVFLGSRLTKSMRRKTYDLSADELSKAIQLTTETSEEQGLLNEIVKFYSKTASEVMTPRVDIVALEYHTPYSEVLRFVIDKGYSRIPVYDDRIDDMKGILYIKDLLPHLSEGDEFHWQSLLRPVFYVPDSKRVDRLLEDFREQKIHVGIVVDEFGGTSGLVTMEDLLEEIVGEISDEYDDDDRLYRQEPDGSYVLDAKLSLVDFIRIVKIEESPMIEEMKEEVDTIGGLLLEIKGEFPIVGEEIVVDEHRFIILEMGRRRISMVKFIKRPEPDQEGGTHS